MGLTNSLFQIQQALANMALVRNQRKQIDLAVCAINDPAVAARDATWRAFARAEYLRGHREGWEQRQRELDSE